MNLLTGWHFITASQKRHYFHDGLSLCRRFYAVCNPHPILLPNTSNTAIAPCEQKLQTGSTRREKR